MAYTPPRSGEFRHALSVERRTNLDDQMGGSTDAWVTHIPKIYAAISEERGNEEVRAQRMAGISRQVVTVRSSDDTQSITTGDRLLKTVTRTILPDNMTSNYNFETGLWGWYDNATAAASYTGTAALPTLVTNYQAAPTAIQNPGTGVPRTARGTPIPVRVGRKYRARARYWCTHTNTRIDVGASLFNASGVYQTVQRVVIQVPSGNLNQWIDVSLDLTGTDNYAMIAPIVALNNNSLAGAWVTIDRAYIEDYTDAGTITTTSHHNIKWIGDLEGRGRFLNLYCEKGAPGNAS